MDTQLSTLTKAARQAAEACEQSLSEGVAATRARVLAYGRALLSLRNAIKGKKNYHQHLIEHRLAIRDSVFRSNALWLAKREDDLVKSPNHPDLVKSLSQCPYSNPGDIRNWLRKQEPAEAEVPNNKPTQIGKTPKAIEARRAVRDAMERGEVLSVGDLGKKTGLSRIVIEAAIAAEQERAEVLREVAENTPVDILALADAVGLSKTAKAKLAAMEARWQKQKDAEIERLVRSGISEHINEYVLPDYSKRLAQADMVLSNHYKPAFTDEEYRLLLSVLHPDANNPDRRREAFEMIKKKEILLRREKDRRPLGARLPTTLEGLMAMRRQRKDTRSNAAG